MTRKKKSAHPAQIKRQRAKKKDAWRTDHIEKSDMKNGRFDAYYEAQGIVPDDEWDVMQESFQTPLPTTFRIAGNRQTSHDLKRTIDELYVPSLSKAMFEDERVSPPVQISWYPEGLAWQFNVPKRVLRKSPEFKKFHSFLVFETDVGNISRQEAVSMLPPLFLDVQPHHYTIDMCAAPGSKTSQLLEALHAQDTSISTSFPPGFLIANDSDNKRTHLLIHQSARLPSPAFMVTNLDASIYPAIKLPAEGPNARKTVTLLFDRILCDVPCSGDGTLRKNVGIWKNWNPGDGNGLHGLQLRILQRAMKMLKSDGKIVYSTCSLNPVENEAVIAAALNSNPAFEIVDVSALLPELLRRPGLTAWKPTADRAVSKTYASFEEFLETLSEQQKTDTKLTAGHWPPPNVAELHLENCMRIYPHLQDTGGFFVAVLQKKVEHRKDSNDPKKREIEEPFDAPETKRQRSCEGDTLAAHMCNDSAPSASSPTFTGSSVGEFSQTKSIAKVNDDDSFRENPFTFLAADDPILLSCIRKLNLTSAFPAHNVLVRNPAGQPARSLYLTNDIVKRVVLHNDYKRLRLTSCGIKVFMKQEGGKGIEAQFRVLGEGLSVVLPFIQQDTFMEGSSNVLETLMRSLYPLINTFEEPFKKAIEDRDAGSHIVRFPAGSYGEVSIMHDIVLPIWKSNASISLMIDKKAKSALSVRIFGEDISTTRLGAQDKRAEQISVDASQVTTDKGDSPQASISDGN